MLTGASSAYASWPCASVSRRGRGRLRRNAARQRPSRSNDGRADVRCRLLRQTLAAYRARSYRGNPVPVPRCSYPRHRVRHSRIAPRRRRMRRHDVPFSTISMAVVPANFRARAHETACEHHRYRAGRTRNGRAPVPTKRARLQTTRRARCSGGAPSDTPVRGPIGSAAFVRLRGASYTKEAAQTRGPRRSSSPNRTTRRHFQERSASDSCGKARAARPTLRCSKGCASSCAPERRPRSRRFARARP